MNANVCYNLKPYYLNHIRIYTGNVNNVIVSRSIFYDTLNSSSIVYCIEKLKKNTKKLKQ